MASETKGKRKFQQAPKAEAKKKLKVDNKQPEPKKKSTPVQADSNWAKLSQTIKPNTTNNNSKPFNKGKGPNNFNKSNNFNSKPNKFNNNKPHNSKPNNHTTNNEKKVNVFDPSSFMNMSAFYDGLKPTTDDATPTDALALLGSYDTEKKAIWIVLVNSHGNACLNLASEVQSNSLLPEQTKKLKFLPHTSSIPGDVKRVPFAAIGKSVQGLIKSRTIVTRDAGDLLQLLMVGVQPKNKREFLKYPPLQDLDYFQLCKQYLNIQRYPAEATIIDQGRILQRVFANVRREWKQHLFNQKIGKKDGEEKVENTIEQEDNDDELNEPEIVEQESEEQEEEEEQEPVELPPQQPKKRSRFISKSAPGSYRKWRPKQEATTEFAN